MKPELDMITGGAAGLPRRRKWRSPVAIASAIAVVLFALAWFFAQQGRWGGDPTRVDLSGVERNVAADDPKGIIYDTQVMPISEVEAKELNELRPVDIKDVIPARPFAIPLAARTGMHFSSAVECLQQAIYYEAANESETGQRAVAQVILNRVKHPAFPNSVCGVVYQGSHLRTGCQFTFTCDGSLARVPSVAGFARARRIAEAALSGTVEASVGTATHYHANYVLPYWAGSLNKVASIGAHIFYAMRGPAGSGRAFNALYEPLGEFVRTPASLSAFDFALDEEMPAEATEDATATPPGPKLIEDERQGWISAPAPSGELKSQPGSGLRADEAKGELVAPVAGSKLVVD